MMQHSYRYPAPRETVAFVASGIADMRKTLAAAQDRRIAGLGIAVPFELWSWADAAGAPREIMEEWRHLDIKAEIKALCDFPVYLQNDATSACGAELVFGKTSGLRDFLYFYIGAFAGGGIVLDGRLYGGPTGNAGALGVNGGIGADAHHRRIAEMKLSSPAQNQVEAKCGCGPHQPRQHVAAEVERVHVQRRRQRQRQAVVRGVVITGVVPGGGRSRHDLSESHERQRRAECGQPCDYPTSVMYHDHHPRRRNGLGMIRAIRTSQ